MKHAITAALLSVAVPVVAAGQEAGRLSLDSLLATPVSSSAKYRQTITEAAGAVSLITAAEIEAYGYRSLEQILATVRGLYLSYDRNYTYVGARGFSRPTDFNNRILLLVDGHQMNEGIWGTAPLGPEGGIDVGSIERIEIVRGPSSALYGTGALLGVINVVTRNAAGPGGGHLATEVGSLATLGASGGIGRELGHGVRLALSGFFADRKGEDLHFAEFDSVGNGIARDLDWERRGGIAAALTAGPWVLHGRYSSRTKGIPTASYGMTFGDRRANTRDDYGFVELKYGRSLTSGLELSGRAYYDRYWYTGDYPADGVVSDEAGANDRIGAEILGRWDLRSDNRLTVGTEIRRQATARYYSPRTGTPSIDLDVPHTLLSIFAQDEFQVTARVALIAGLRHDYYTTTGGATAPRAGVVYDAARGTAFKLLYGEGFRAPNISEANDSDGFRRNPDLRPEDITTWELIWQQRLGAGVLGTVSLYDQRLRGLIDLTADSAAGESFYIYRNVGDARSTGIEVGLDARLADGFQGYGSYSAQRAVDEHDARLTNSPTHQLRIGAAARIRSGLRGSLQVRHESRRRTVYDTWTRASTVTDAHLEAGPFRRLRGLAVSLRIDNLFDVAYATPGGVEHVQPAIEQDGRLVSVRLGWRF